MWAILLREMIIWFSKVKRIKATSTCLISPQIKSLINMEEMDSAVNFKP